MAFPEQHRILPSEPISTHELMTKRIMNDLLNQFTQGVIITGPSSSGKTTLAAAVAEKLRASAGEWNTYFTTPQIQNNYDLDASIKDRTGIEFQRLPDPSTITDHTLLVVDEITNSPPLTSGRWETYVNNPNSTFLLLGHPTQYERLNPWRNLFPDIPNQPGEKALPEYILGRNGLVRI